MRNDTMLKTRLTIACGALLALGLAGCNREREQMDTEPATTATTETAPPADTMPTETMPPSPMTPAAPMTTMPPSDSTMPGATGEVPADTTTEPPMDETDTAQPNTDASGAPPTR